MPSSTPLWSTTSVKTPIAGWSWDPIAGNLLELIVLVNREGDELIIHAMLMRPKYRRLLER